jgi:hypothetical protein
MKNLLNTVQRFVYPELYTVPDYFIMSTIFLSDIESKILLCCHFRTQVGCYMYTQFLAWTKEASRMALALKNII